MATVVLAGMALTAALAVRAGVDTRGAVTLAFILSFGVLAIAAIRKVSTGTVEPFGCPDCKGLNSPNAPYCKHCGVHFEE